VATSDRVADLPAPLGRRERKKLATKDRIVESAVALFAARGYEATTMDDIGERADVARATVFNYFPRKEDIVFDWIARRRAEMATILAGDDETADADTAARLRRAFRALAHAYEDDPATGRAMVRAFLRVGGPLVAQASESPALLADTIRTGQRRGDIPRGLDPTAAGLALFDAYLGTLYRWVNEDEGPAALEQNLTTALEVILSGIAPDPHADGQTAQRPPVTSRMAPVT
jgi:TetR/AcrR family transcriptional regulator, cholesterol catabolism regulator